MNQKQKGGLKMPSPVFNKMNTVFIHVAHLKTSVKWYSDLLNQAKLRTQFIILKLMEKQD